jgi:hypothetical protein
LAVPSFLLSLLILLPFHVSAVKNLARGVPFAVVQQQIDKLQAKMNARGSKNELGKQEFRNEVAPVPISQE